MTPISDSSRRLYNSLRSLYPYGSHVQLAALAAALLESAIVWRELPGGTLFWGMVSYSCLSSFYLLLIAYAQSRPTLKVNKTCRLMLGIVLLQALWWGSSIFLIKNATLPLYALHTLFLYSSCVLFTLYLASLPPMAYAFLTISLTPMIYILFSKAPADMQPLALCLLALTFLLGITIHFRSKASHNAIQKQNQDRRTLRDLKTQLQTKITSAIASNDAIWDTILTITDQSHLQNTWQNCFSGKLSSLCQPLKTDRIYIVEADRDAREATIHAKDKYQASIDHSWIFNNPDCLVLLQEGKVVHHQSPQLSELEQKTLQDLGILAFLDIPILLKNELWGFIGMDRLTNATSFTPQEVKGLQFIANILAMTIRNQQDRLERDRLVTVIEQSSDCTLITDPDGQILYASPSCETITGYSHTETMGTNIKKFYPETVMDTTIWQQITTALKNGEKWHGQFTNHRKDHTLYEEEMLLSPAYNHEGTIATQVIVKRNITEKKRLESIVEAANLMDNIGFIFSSIRHELGNPINSIKVSLSVLDSNLESYDKINIKRFINRSLSDIVRVEYLLKTLKNFSVFERPIIEETDMTTLLTTFIPLITTDLKQKNIRLSAHIPRESILGMIDPRAFQQVLLNLIANAADSLAETVKKHISLTMQREENGQINIIIGDNGCGIGDHEQTNLFKPFFTTKPQGTGLGLVIVKKMLSKMNCSIDIHSKSNAGTKVIIVIPGC